MTETVKSALDQREQIQFEKLVEGIYSLNYKKDNTRMKYTKEQIFKIIETGDEVKLREASRYFFGISGEYRRLVWLHANILTFDYYVIPKIRNPEKVSQEKIKTELQRILDYTDNSYVQQTNRFISLITVLDGVFYGYERQMDDDITLQQLPPKFCRSKYKINGNHAIEFNLKFFDMYRDTDLKIEMFTLFPDEFFDLYVDYKNGRTKDEWAQLDSEYTRCHKLNDDPIPLLSTVFPEIIDLKEYKELDKSQAQMDLYKLIVQKLPIDKLTGLPMLKLEEGRELHKNAKKMITQEGIDVLTTPLEVDSINLKESGQTIKSNIERASNRIYTTSGNSQILFNGGSDGGSIGLDKSIKVDEAVMLPLLDQHKRWYETKFKKVSKNKNISFSMEMPLITIFNRAEMVEMYTKQASMGYSALLPIIASGITQSSFLDILHYENEYLGLHDKMIPLKTAHTLGGEEDEGGAPEKKEGDLSTKGLETRNKKANENRAQA